MFTKVMVPVPVIFVLLTLLAAASSGVAAALEQKQSRCLSWRVAVEANNARAWSSVPPTCVQYVQDYMLQGQYQRDLDAVTYQIFAYLNNTINVAADGMDAWVLDIDDTILSNLLYYEGKHYGGDPYDPLGFRSWAQRGICAAIPKMLRVYKRLIEKGFKVFLITGRDAEMFNSSTSRNLDAQGFKGHERLIMRGADYRGVGASVFKSTMRKRLMDEGYRIRGNVGDQWSDLLGECNGDRIFKVPNPMYFVP